ncbi:RAxF-45 family protein [Caldifermentibacillus hisashii]|nr:RAxF-45 family protein [Caldifermentibacillus hisashii]
MENTVLLHSNFLKFLYFARAKFAVFFANGTSLPFFSKLNSE